MKARIELSEPEVKEAVKAYVEARGFEVGVVTLHHHVDLSNSGRDEFTAVADSFADTSASPLSRTRCGGSRSPAVTPYLERLAGENPCRWFDVDSLVHECIRLGWKSEKNSRATTLRRAVERLVLDPGYVLVSSRGRGSSREFWFGKVRHGE